MKKKKIGIMGGTFDPVHYGHLLAAEEAYSHFGLDQVLFIPSGQPPHKRRPGGASCGQRLAMTALAVATNANFAVSSTEVRRAGYSYSVDTVSALLAEYGTDTDFTFIVGTDAALELPTWHEAERLLALVDFVVAARPGFAESALQQLPSPWQRKMTLLRMPLLEISSTDIRNRVREGRPIKYLLPEAVENYIYAEGLYRDESGAAPGGR
ncbi:MAG: nicotinate-nucleotide adenylyltransferase [Clostridia bacterium]|nr:nicotinate-nucleotide adenylyltransferase [Clostridia bacterium]